MIALKCSLVMLMLLAFLVVNAAGTVFRPADKAELQTAVDLWCSDRASAMATYGFIGDWNTSLITDMSWLFANKVDFNDDISAWITSSVTTMQGMFYFATSFNNPLQNWDVTSVTTMEGMFYYATSFNNPLQNWDVTSVTSMFYMFAYASSFNNPLQNWDVTSVTDMSYMFYLACSFHQDLSSWNKGDSFMPGSECNGKSAAPTLEPTNPMTQIPTELPTDIPTELPTKYPTETPIIITDEPTAHPVHTDFLCANIKDWRRKKLYPANSLVKSGVRVYEATQQNQRKKPTRHQDLWIFIANCHTSCKGAPEWRSYKTYFRGDVVTDKQKNNLYRALKKAQGKEMKPGKANNNGKLYWRQIDSC